LVGFCAVDVGVAEPANVQSYVTVPTVPVLWSVKSMQSPWQMDVFEAVNAAVGVEQLVTTI